MDGAVLFPRGERDAFAVRVDRNRPSRSIRVNFSASGNTSWSGRHGHAFDLRRSQNPPRWHLTVPCRYEYNPHGNVRDGHKALRSRRV